MKAIKISVNDEIYEKIAAGAKKCSLQTSVYAKMLILKSMGILEQEREKIKGD